jgi:hypothetical protein
MLRRRPIDELKEALLRDDKTDTDINVKFI